MSSKRARHIETSDDGSSSSSSASEGGHVPKLARSAVGATAEAPLLCTLPPTCSARPTPLRDTRELEAHYARAHAHVCAAPGCARVFPDARLLELHHTECHDPIAAMRKERGEKIFACHIATCPKVCATPRTRRLHLIEAHHYPKQYFFAITNKGIGGLLQQWGEGATLVRGEWKPRSGAWHQEAEQTEVQMEEEEGGPSIPPGQSIVLTRRQKSRLRQREKRAQQRMVLESSDGDDDGDAEPPSAAPAPRAVRFADAEDADAGMDEDGRPGLGDGLNTLVEQLGTMTFVPRNIKFGHGGAMRGFAGAGDGDEEEKKTRRTGRGGRGRARRKAAPAGAEDDE